MKIAIFSPVFNSFSLEEALKYLNTVGVTMLELGCGGYPGTKHANILELLDNENKIKELKELFLKYNIGISALSVHGNGVHPNKTFAAKSTQELDAAIVVAKQLGVDTVVTFSGCPGDKTSSFPNWVTCPWPNDFSELLEWQWNSVLIPYWKERAKIAEANSVKIALEMHPGFCVYNPQTLLRLRAAVGPCIGANLDPSHLIWQGINIPTAIKVLGEQNALFYFHAKDTGLNDEEVKVNGVLDTKSYEKELQRSWIFRTVGYGGCDWKAIFSTLKIIKYEGFISIEHEDSLMSRKEGLEKAINFLKEVMIFEETTKKALWWI